MSRSVAKQKPADMQEGLKCHRGESGGRGSVEALSDLCPPREEPRKEQTNRATLGLSVEGTGGCGKFTEGKMSPGRAGLRCSVMWQFSDGPQDGWG